MLGIFFLGCGVFGLWGVIEIASQLQMGDNRHLTVVMLAAVMATVAALDFRVRKRRIDVYDTNSLFHPSTGGSFWYLPIWAIFSGIAICVLFLLFVVR
ncbi:membrane protein [Rhodopirellula maiorica SM1]|uniref:Membrane protein n=1 Tax=Rhodopirellula maiorica SM1 TaxID=1265738 RepID=M5RYY5_9BACT|nr:membrane protein [Rhodopirellula maiorica SM1]